MEAIVIVLTGLSSVLLMLCITIYQKLLKERSKRITIQQWYEILQEENNDKR